MESSDSGKGDARAGEGRGGEIIGGGGVKHKVMARGAECGGLVYAIDHNISALGNVSAGGHTGISRDRYAGQIDADIVKREAQVAQNRGWQRGQRGCA